MHHEQEVSQTQASAGHELELCNSTSILASNRINTDALTMQPSNPQLDRGQARSTLPDKEYSRSLPIKRQQQQHRRGQIQLLRVKFKPRPAGGTQQG